MRSVNRLTDRTVRTISRPGRHSDGAGLYLEVRDRGSRSWLFMAKSGGRQKWLGLGRYPDTPLGLAREKAASARRMMAEGGDPFAEAKKGREPTFGEC
ncbi:MAG TPA: Arm DNA-binding domain-containing protein, partial [Mesorhizobium sp.]